MLNLEPIKARVAALPNETWVSEQTGVFADGRVIMGAACGDAIRASSRPAADFIAGARQDVPALVAEVEELRRLVSSLVQAASVAYEEGGDLTAEALDGLAEAISDTLDSDVMVQTYQAVA